MREVLVTLCNQLLFVDVPDIDRYYRISAPEHILKQIKNLFTTDSNKTDLFKNAFIPGVGIIEFEEIDSNEISLKLMSPKRVPKELQLK